MCDTDNVERSGNSYIRMSRAKMLGGCSSHNDCVAMRPCEYDTRQWAKLGATGWSFDTFSRLLGKLRTHIEVVHPTHRNDLCRDWMKSASKAAGVPYVADFNQKIGQNGNISGGTGWMNVAYFPEDKRRSSASVNYIHPVLVGQESRPNLMVLTGAWVDKVNFVGDMASGVNLRSKSGKRYTVKATEETIICAGAIDTPRLLLLSGIGPAQQLRTLGIPLVKDVPGVGENLMDHPDSMVLYELNRPLPTNTTMDSDCMVAMRRNPINLADGDYSLDVHVHMYSLPLETHTRRLGYPVPEWGFTMMPNVPRPKSRGRIFLKSADPSVKPAIDFRYFTDAEGYDEATLVAGIKLCRKISDERPFKDWIVREVAPGPSVQTDEEIAEYACRQVANTVYHPCGSTKMGDVDADPMAVVDSELKVRGLKRLRVADAGVFPSITTLNPMITVLCIGERAAELIAGELDWIQGLSKL